METRAPKQEYQRLLMLFFTRKYHNTVRRKAKMNITKRLLALILIFSFALPLAANAEATATVTASEMVVRSGPSSSYSVLGSLEKGTVVTVLAASDGIAKISYKGNTGYARIVDMELNSAEEETEEEMPAGEGQKGYVTATKLKVYASPDIDSKVVATLSRDDSITLYAQKDGWAQIAQGYTFLGGLGPSKYGYSEQTGTVDSEGATVYMQASTSSARLGTAKPGTKLIMLDVNGDWVRVENDGMVGYTLLSRFVTHPGTEVNGDDMVSVDSIEATAKEKIYIYDAPSSSAERIGYLNAGNSVTVLKKNDSWAYVTKSGNYGYTPLSGLQNGNGLDSVASYTAIAKARVYVYDAPGTSATQIGYLNEGESVTVSAKDDTWAYITRGSNTGYTKLDGLRSASDESEELKSVTPYQAAATTNLYVYSQASDAGESLGVLKTGMIVTVQAESQNWARIEREDGAIGYARKSGLAKVEYDTSDAQSAVAKEDVTIYASASTSATVLGTLKKGSTVNVLATNGSWARLERNGEIGYCKKSSLETADYTTLKSGSSGSAVTKLQSRLEALGYFDGVPTGNYSLITTAAVKRFQAEAGLSESGIADAATQSALYSSSAKASSIRSVSLSKGDKGEDVVRLQTRLTYLGYFSSSVDGDYGALTETAVAMYQKVMGLSTDGKAGSRTMSSLFSSSAKACPDDMEQPSEEGGSGGSVAAPDKSKAEIVCETALAQLGKSYVFASSGPNSYDCSGLVYYAYKQVGVSLSRSAQTQGYEDGTKIESISDLKRGDIVCFNTVSDSDLSDHTGIYLGNGQFVHASSSAGKVVVSSLSSGYYKTNFSWGRRVL